MSILFATPIGYVLPSMAFDAEMAIQREILEDRRRREAHARAIARPPTPLARPKRRRSKKTRDRYTESWAVRRSLVHQREWEREHESPDYVTRLNEGFTMLDEDYEP